MSEELKCARKGCGLEKLHAVHDYADRRGYHAFVASPVAPAEPPQGTCNAGVNMPPHPEGLRCANWTPLQETTTPAPSKADLARMMENLRHYQSGAQYERDKAAEVIALMEATLATQARTLDAARMVAEHAQHGPHCPQPNMFGAPCSCGLTALRRALTTEPTP